MELEHGLARHVCPVVMGRIVLLTSKKTVIGLSQLISIQCIGYLAGVRYKHL